MNQTNLIVVVSAAPTNEIKHTFPHHRLIDDGQLFNILNGQAFEGKQYGLDTISQLCDDLTKSSATNPIVLHTFNPLMQNYLMCYKSVSSSESPLEDDIDATRKRFLLWKSNDESGNFFSALDLQRVMSKLDVLCIGEALCDTHLEFEITEHVLARRD